MKSIAVKHILVEQEYEAEDILKKIKDGSSFEELAQKFSKCPSQSRGGDLGAFSQGKMVVNFEQAAFELEIGQISKSPVKTQFGYHLIYRYE